MTTAEVLKCPSTHVKKVHVKESRDQVPVGVVKTHEEEGECSDRHGCARLEGLRTSGRRTVEGTLRAERPAADTLETKNRGKSTRRGCDVERALAEPQRRKETRTRKDTTKEVNDT